MSTKKSEKTVEKKKPALHVALGIHVVSARALGELLSSTMDDEIGKEKPDMKLLSVLSNALASSARSAENIADVAN